MHGYFGRPTLWNCLMRCLRDQYAVKWTNRADGCFRFTHPYKFFERWNSQGGRVSYVENIWRSLRHYTVEGRLVKLHGRMHAYEYQIPPTIMKSYESFFNHQD